MRLDMISRRRFLKSAGVAALAVAAAGVLAGCDGGSNSGSGNVTPAPVPGATEDVNIIFFDDETSEIIGEGILKNVLKTADMSTPTTFRRTSSRRATMWQSLRIWRSALRMTRSISMSL